MPVDTMGLVFSVVAMSGAVVAIILSFRQYQWSKHDFYRTMAIAWACLIFWLSQYVVISLLNDPEYYLIVQLNYEFAAFGVYVGAALLVIAFETVKTKPSRSRDRFMLFGAGVLSALHINPNYYYVQWGGINWVVWQSPILTLAMALFLSIGVAFVSPLFYRIWYRSKQSNQFGRRIIFLFIGSVSMCIWGLFSRIWRSIGVSEIRGPLDLFFNHPLSFLLYFGLFFYGITLLNYLHPTIFFSASSDLIGVHLIVKNSHVPVYYYNFHRIESDIGADLFSMACVSIELVLRESLKLKSRVECINTGDSNILLAQGQAILGILVTETNDPLLPQLLDKLVQEFEERFSEDITGIIQPKLFKPFDVVVERYFEFGLSTRPRPLIL